MARKSKWVRLKAGRKGKRRVGTLHIDIVFRPDGDKFEACMRLKPQTGGKKKSKNLTCGLGRNPRKAISAAARAFAKSIGHRPGAFYGVGL